MLFSFSYINIFSPYFWHKNFSVLSRISDGNNDSLPDRIQSNFFFPIIAFKLLGWWTIFFPSEIYDRSHLDYQKKKKVADHCNCENPTFYSMLNFCSLKLHHVKPEEDAGMFCS